MESVSILDAQLAHVRMLGTFFHEPLAARSSNTMITFQVIFEIGNSVGLFNIQCDRFPCLRLDVDLHGVGPLPWDEMRHRPHWSGGSG